MKKMLFSSMIVFGVPLFGAASQVPAERMIEAIEVTRGAPFIGNIFGSREMRLIMENMLDEAKLNLIESVRLRNEAINKIKAVGNLVLNDTSKNFLLGRTANEESAGLDGLISAILTGEPEKIYPEVTRPDGMIGKVKRFGQ